jgi:hypothetical protein
MTAIEFWDNYSSMPGQARHTFFHDSDFSPRKIETGGPLIPGYEDDSGSDISDGEGKGDGEEIAQRSLPGARLLDDELKPLLMFDCRPQADAFASLEEGKGFEDPKRYQNAQIQFWGVVRPSLMRASLEAVEQICACKSNYSEENFMTEIANTGWLQGISSVIDGAAHIVNCIDRKQMSGEQDCTCIITVI